MFSIMKISKCFKSAANITGTNVGGRRGGGGRRKGEGGRGEGRREKGVWKEEEGGRIPVGRKVGEGRRKRTKIPYSPNQ